MRTLFVLTLLCQPWLVATAEEVDRPNIVFIMADDLGYGDLGCYGQRLIQTPHIDRLAEQGLRFTQAYAGSTVCAASRGVLMTGLHNGHAPVRDNIPHYETYLQETDITIAEVLKQAGYRCGGIGKWSLGDAKTVGCATKKGFDKWFGYLNQDHAHYYYPEYLDDDDGRLELNGNSQSHANYSHDLMTERALDFIRQSGDQPFFFYGAYTLPHYSSASEDATQLAIPSDAPYTDREWSQQEKNYAAMITKLDRDVGRLVALIDELGLAKQTLVIFTSDNGPWGQAPDKFDSNGPLRGAKRDLYEGGIRVPLIARWLGRVPSGKTSDEMIAFWDMLPTFAEIAGAETPENLDGISIVDALLGGEIKTPDRFLYWDYGHCRVSYDQAVRLGNWKGIRRGQGKPVELYDLSRDVGETVDLASSNPQIVKTIETIMDTTATASERYPIGEIYKGRPIWQK